MAGYQRGLDKKAREIGEGRVKLQYSRLISDLYGNLLPNEILKTKTEELKATCNACIQVPHYDPSLKCCTFHPFLPNYLVGQILLDEKSNPTFITETLKHKISNRIFVLPLGIVAPLKFQVELLNLKQKKFGNAQDWLCPYYDKVQNRCGIWQNRGSVCTSFYCESSKNKSGLNYWKKSLDYLSAIEMGLAEEALARLDFSPRQVSDQLEFFNRKELSAQEKKLNRLSKKTFNKIWNGTHDIEAFYVKTLDVVKSLKRQDVKSLMGEHGDTLTRQFVQAGEIWKS